MTTDAPDIVDQAIAWHLRLDCASTEDWYAFIEWLEADPAHRDAYDRIVMDDARIPPVTASRRPANDDAPADDAPQPRRIVRLWMARGGLAAAAAAVLAILTVDRQPADALRTIATAPGQTRTVRLDDGTLIEMNGATRLTLKRGNDRYAVLQAGEAIFHVRHDSANPFELVAGRARVRDLGTVFNVARDGDYLGVDVAEGAVLFETGQKAVRLTQGMAISIRNEGSSPVLRSVDAKNVGGWRHGLLDVRDMPVEAVAHAVSRSTGVPIRFTHDTGDRRFTGTLHLTDAPDVVIPRFAALIGARYDHAGGEWMLTIGSDDGL